MTSAIKPVIGYVIILVSKLPNRPDPNDKNTGLVREIFASTSADLVNRFGWPQKHERHEIEKTLFVPLVNFVGLRLISC